jgi:type II secretory ATPase GspE/PulE/Tfp pilus assembly ATPase PilB-like protein
MMVGEIRDLETAELAIRTALTGHLVFSTLHTNDAAGGISRLLDMGIEPFLISSSVLSFIAQRLVRLICSDCKEEIDIEEEIINEIGVSIDELEGKRFYRGAGCEECKHTGYKGRTGIFEILTVDEEIRDLIMQKVPASTIKQKAIDLGMRTLRQDGWQKVINGLTTIEEVLRVSQEDEFQE